MTSFASDLDYYRSVTDYDEIKEYLDMTPVEASLEDNMFPEFKPDFSSSIVVDNIPQVGPEKLTKLLAILLKIYAQIVPVKEEDIYMPFNEATGLTCGFCFIKFANADDAEKAIKATQAFPLDKKHIFKVSSYNDLDKYAKVQEDDKPPAMTDFHPKPEISSWLTDVKGRDQFAVRHGKDTEIYWSNAAGEEPGLVYGGEREKQNGKTWCELTVEWSPQGTYFTTFHKPGVKLWGGADFQAQGKFMHPNVEEISFSPCENYIITYRLGEYPNVDPKERIIVWDVRTGEKLKVFEVKNPLEEKFQVQAMITEDNKGKKIERLMRGRVKFVFAAANDLIYTLEEGNTVHTNILGKVVSAMQDPNRLKWSADGKYVARLGPDLISVYELPGMNLLDKKSIGAKDVLDFSWSPKGNYISYYSPAVGTFPGLINIIRIPDRKELSSRKLVDVTDGKMVWQNDGEYLCVHMTKTSGKKKSYVLMFFRVSVSGVPVEQTDLNEPIINVQWEPSRDRVAIMYGDTRSPQIAFYAMSTTVASKAPTATKNTQPQVTIKAELTHLLTKSCGPCTEISWSPAGGVIVMTYFAPDAGLFEFFDVDSNLTLSTRRHDRCQKTTWDPSGRYLATYTVTDMKSPYAKSHMDDGVNFYTFQGTLLHSMKREKLYLFSWRPRPKDLLSSEEKKKIIKNLRKYEREFEKEDKARKDELSQELQALRHQVAKDFLTWMHHNQALSAKKKASRVDLRDGYDSDDERNYEFEVVSA